MNKPPGMRAELLMGGRSTAALDGRTFVRRNPVTGEVATIAAAAGITDAETAADIAAAAFPGWSSLGPGVRRETMNSAADAFRARSAEFIAAMREETGATEGWAQFNLRLAEGMMREAASLTTHIGGEVLDSDKPGCLAMAVRKPAGVVLGIAPWNAPLILGVRAIATPLACGNTVIFKASEICPRTHVLIGEAFASALPAGVVSVINNAPEDAAQIVGALIDHRAVRRINFTGSTRVGREVARRAADNLKPVLLELGGKAPLLVLEDADLDEAVKAAAFGAFMNQGQICMSTERIVVIESVADEFIKKLAFKAMHLISGDPRNGVTPLGTVIDASSADRIRRLIDDAVANGAVLAAGGPGVGVFMPATVLDRVTRKMRLYQEESFGPVVTVLRARDADEAVGLANDTEYGLSASIFTANIARGIVLANRIQSGICHINGPTVHDEAHMPFGGMKASGYGRFGGKAGIAEFTDLRWLTIETQSGRYPL